MTNEHDAGRAGQRRLRHPRGRVRAPVWESLTVESVTGVVAAQRAKVPGGWLVAVSLTCGAGVTFYPDPEHRWDGSSLP